MKRFWSILIGLLMIMTYFRTPAFAEDLKVNFKFGFDNAYKIGSYAPCYIEVVNSGEDIVGEVQVEVKTSGYNGGGKIFAVEANIPKGGTKNFAIGVPVEQNLSSVTVRVFDGRNKIYEKNETTSLGYSTDGSFNFIGILSDDFDSVNYFNYDDRVTRTFKFTEANFPQDKNLLGSLDTILINNFETSKLTAAQYTALKDWVSGGGTLIIGTGPSYTKTLSIFKDNFLSYDIGSLTEIESGELYSFIGKTGSAMRINSLDIRLKGSNNAASKGLLQVSGLGSGKIILSTFDFGLKPISDWQFRGELSKGIIQNLGSKALASAGMGKGGFRMDPYAIENALRVNPDLKLPRVSTYIFIFIAYILLVGPVNYLVLKRMDRREFLWLTIPALSLIFTFGIYLQGSGTRIRNPIASVINVVDVGLDGSYKVDTAAGVMTPRKADIKVVGEDETRIRPMVRAFNEYNGMPGSTTGNLYYKYLESAKPSLEFYNVGAFDIRTFQLQGTGVKENLRLEANIAIENGVLKGSVKNTSGIDLKNCIIVTQSSYYKIDELKNGETKVLPGENSYGDTYQLINSLIPMNYGPTNNMSEAEIKAFKEREQTRNMYMYYFGRGINGARFIGVGEKALSGDFKVNGGSVKKSEKMLLSQEIGLDFRKGNTIEYPFGFIQPTINGSNFKYDGYMYFGSGEMELVFNIDQGMRVEEAIIKSSGNSNNTISEIYNYLDNKWEAITLDFGGTTKRGDMNKYVSSNNTMKLRLKSGSMGDANFALPLLSVRGGVK